MPPPKFVAGMSPTRLQRLHAWLQRDYVDPGRIPGALWLVARHGQVVGQGALGWMDLERRRPMRPNTLVRIYSMTKPIASVALMMLWEDGRFQLEDPVHAYLPSWREQRVWVSGEGAGMVTRPPRQPMTMRQLLSHTGGLTYGTALLAPGVTPHPVEAAYQALNVGTRNGDTLATLVDKLGRVPLRYEPGEAWSYSFSTDVVGFLVEQLSGLPFERFLQDRLLAPLGMVDTHFTVPIEKGERLASCYSHVPNGPPKRVDDGPASAWLEPPALHSGGGGLVSSMADYLRFCEMLRRGGELEGARVLGPRTLALMRQNHIAGGRDVRQAAVDSFAEPLMQGVGFGLGFATTLSDVAAGVPGGGDFYWSGLASTLFWVDPREDLVAILMTQLIPSRTYNLRGAMKNIVYSSIVE